MTVARRSAPLVAALLLLGALGLAGLPGVTAHHKDIPCQPGQPFGPVAIGTLDEETPETWFHRTTSSPTTLYLMAASSDELSIAVLTDPQETTDGILCGEHLCGTVPNTHGLATCEGDAPGDHWIHVELADGETGPVHFVVTPLGL